MILVCFLSSVLHKKEISITNLIQKKMSTLLKTVNRGHHHITHHLACFKEKDKVHVIQVLHWALFSKNNLRFGLFWAVWIGWFRVNEFLVLFITVFNGKNDVVLYHELPIFFKLQVKFWLKSVWCIMYYKALRMTLLEGLCRRPVPKFNIQMTMCAKKP